MAKTTKTHNTPAPVDLQIKVDPTINTAAKKLAISAEWSIAAENFGGGQSMTWQSYNIETDTEPKWTGKNVPEVHPIQLGVSATNKTFIEQNFSNYYPVASTDNKLTWLHVEVIGKRRTRTANNVKHVYKWSTPAARSVHIICPPDPELSDDVAAGSSDFSKTFSWTVPAVSVWIGKDKKESLKKKKKKTSTRYKKKKYGTFKNVNYKDDDELIEVFYDTQWQSILVDNLADPNFNPELDTNWAPGKPGWQTGTTTAGQTSCTQTITESHSSWTGNYSYTRYFRVKSRGPGGDSDWDYDYVIYYNAAAPAAPTRSVMDGEGNITMGDTEKESVSFPSKYISYQYLNDIPETSIAYNSNEKKWKVTISPPSGSTSWVEAMKVPANTEVTFPSIKPTNDKLTWTRKVFTGLDDSQRNGEAKLVDTASPAPLTPPTGISISDIDTEQKRMTVSATNNSQVSSAYLLVYCRNAAGNEKCVGLIPHGESGGVTIQAPKSWDFSKTEVGVRAMLADYSYANDSDTGRIYTPTNIKMASEIVWDGGTLPSPPTGLRLSLGNTMGTIIAEWNWEWADANVAEISWSESPEAWESTSPPSTYDITNTHAGKWYITGLSVGEWYVRVRLGKTENDVTTWSAYGLTDGNLPIKVVSVPDRPHLMITPKVITPDGEVKLSWVYSSEDGAPLNNVYIAKDGHLDGPLITVKNQSTITLKRDNFSEELRWNDGDTVSLRIKTESSENKQSEWSLVGNDGDSTFQVASLPTQPTVTFTNGWNASKQIVVDGSTTTEACLVSLPFEFTVGNITTDNYPVVQIIREVEDIIKTPDENEYPVYADDAVYLNNSLTGPGTVSIYQKDLIGSLDDKHYFKLVVSNTDKYGQSAEPLSIRFRVEWDHKAIKPSANITIDRENDVTFIRTIQPTGYLAGDVCDIYRLSVDKPELIINNAAFGTWYVDEYPTIGEFGGYKVVYRTFNGDIRTDGGYAETDYEGEDYSLTDFMSIIDFGRDSVTLRYNLSLSNSWSKDFTETKYLGGAIQGDWNPAVSRTGSIKATVTIQEDPMLVNPEETIEAMRRLAVYAGVCHIRTPDGSNYYANVDVQEDREEKWVKKLAKFSLNITRVDPPDVAYTMRTKAEWDAD